MEIKIKEVSASFKGSANYNSAEIAFTATISEDADHKTAAKMLFDEAKKIVEEKIGLEAIHEKPTTSPGSSPATSPEKTAKPKYVDNCSKCKVKISPRVSEFSQDRFGSKLCMKCQKEEG